MPGPTRESATVTIQNTFDPFSVALPGTINSGDLLLLIPIIGTDNLTTCFSDDATQGFALHGESTDINADCAVGVYWKIASGSESGNVTFTAAGADSIRKSAVVLRYSGQGSASPPFSAEYSFSVNVNPTVVDGVTTVFDGDSSVISTVCFNSEDHSSNDTGWTAQDSLNTAAGTGGRWYSKDSDITSAQTVPDFSVTKTGSGKSAEFMLVIDGILAGNLNVNAPANVAATANPTTIELSGSADTPNIDAATFQATISGALSASGKKHPLRMIQKGFPRRIRTGIRRR